MGAPIPPLQRIDETDEQYCERLLAGIRRTQRMTITIWIAFLIMLASMIPITMASLR